MNRKLPNFKKRARALLSIGFLLLFCNASLAQQISGKIISEDGLGLPGVNVIIEGTAVGTTSGPEGDYTLNVGDANAVLVYSFIGYKSERRPVQNQTTINVTLQPDVQTLNEVVVVGYGTQKK